MKVLVLSTSLGQTSRSRVLALRAVEALRQEGAEVACLDLRDHPLPLCDGDAAYRHSSLPELCAAVAGADAILAATPVYNYDVCASLKNLVELTGRAWEGKTVGFLLAAGGRGSYMAVMSFAASLMLDFRCLIVPRFVFATGGDFEGEAITNPEIETRVARLAHETVRLASALQKDTGSHFGR